MSSPSSLSLPRRAAVVVALAVGLYAARLLLQPAAPTPVKVALAAAPDTAVARGRQVYLKYGCAMCHGPEGAGGFANTNSETEGKVPGVTFVAEGYTKPELRKKILDGLATIGRTDPNGPKPPYRMPGWAGAMSTDELNDLVEYLWSLLPKTGGGKWR